MVFNVHTLYFPGWTLRIEMIYSLLIIGLILVVTKLRKAWLIPILIGSFFIGEPRIRMCMTHFILGILFCIYYPALIKINFQKTVFYKFRWLIYSLIFLLFSLRNFRLVPHLKELFDYMWSKNIFWEHWSAIATFLTLVLLAMNEKVQRKLENKYLLFIGKISHCIYLIHWLLVQVIVERWDLWMQYIPNDYLRFVLLFSIYIGLVLLLATFMYKYIEVPFMNLSKGKGLSFKENAK
ncbi:MAG: peptidoglycan/LPS O-acetylase OafA/YrhL [Paraglaciecola sp.]|jgi:peptidoglycan/LPS O-acetylase OafA/YrhL